MISIVIPQKSKQHLTEQCVSGLCQHTHHPFELIIIDDHGDAEEFEVDRSKCQLRILRASGEGVTSAWNDGIEAADRDTVVLLNNDVIVGATGTTLTWDMLLLKTFEFVESDRRDPIIGVEVRQESALGDRAKLLPNGGQKSMWLSGWFMSCRRSVFSTVGLDTDMKTYFSDLDFQVRAVAEYGCRKYRITMSGMKHLGHRTAHDSKIVPDQRAQWRKDRETFLRKFDALQKRLAGV